LFKLTLHLRQSFVISNRTNPNPVKATLIGIDRIDIHRER
jgi:hypothetical protein